MGDDFSPTVLAAPVSAGALFFLKALLYIYDCRPASRGLFAWFS
jgi:hypothetical protein